MPPTDLVIARNSIVCPRGDGRPGDGIVVDLVKIADAERRIAEVAFVTPQKAPELLATFNETWLLLHEGVMSLELEVITAERSAGSRRAIVVLDEAPRILRERKLATDRSPAGSEDLRRAVLEQDVPYQDCLERVEKIKAARELLRGKLKAIEMAYTSVKKILGESQGYQNAGRQNPRLSGDTGTADVGQENVPTPLRGSDDLFAEVNRY